MNDLDLNIDNIFLDLTENILVKRVGDTENYTPLFPDGSAAHEYPINKEENLMTISQLIARQKQQNSNKKANEKQEISREIANEKQEIFRKLVGKKQLIIYPISNENQSNDFYELCRMIELKTIKSLKLTNVKTQIDKIYTNYLNALKYANKEDLFKLGSCLEFLETKIALQQNSNKSRNKRDKNLNFRKRIKRAVFTGIAAVILFGGLYLFVKSKTSDAIIESNENQIVNISQVDSLINLYCIQKDTILTDYRKQTHIPKKIALPEYESKVKQQIEFYAKYEN